MSKMNRLSLPYFPEYKAHLIVSRNHLQNCLGKWTYKMKMGVQIIVYSSDNMLNSFIMTLESQVQLKRKG